MQIDYAVDAPPLDIRDGYYLLKFPNDGRVRTSSDIEYGRARNAYYYYAGDALQELKLGEPNRGGMIWAHSNGSVGLNSKAKVYERFFVGTESDYNADQLKMGPTAEPLIGPSKK